LPKRNPARYGEFRVVYKVKNQTLRLIQKNIATSISAKWAFPEYVQGFVAGRSIASNASLHLAKGLLMKADIKHFFDSISFGQVSSVFKRLGCRDLVADSFATLCTLNGSLPQGTSSSPIISNIVCEQMDEQLDNLARGYNAIYSRYADDITFSGMLLPRREEVENILIEHGFQMHPDKFFLSRRGQSQYVTGLSVFDDKHPRIPKRMKRNLRLELYYIKRFGLIEHVKRRYGLDEVSETKLLKEGARITGWIDFMTSVEPIIGNRFKSQWIDILGGASELHFFRRYRKVSSSSVGVININHIN